MLIRIFKIKRYNQITKMSEDKQKFTVEEVCKEIDEKSDRIKEIG